MISNFNFQTMTPEKLPLSAERTFDNPEFQKEILAAFSKVLERNKDPNFWAPLYPYLFPEEELPALTGWQDKLVGEVLGQNRRLIAQMRAVLKLLVDDVPVIKNEADLFSPGQSYLNEQGMYQVRLGENPKDSCRSSINWHYKEHLRNAPLFEWLANENCPDEILIAAIRCCMAMTPKPSNLEVEIYEEVKGGEKRSRIKPLDLSGHEDGGLISASTSYGIGGRIMKAIRDKKVSEEVMDIVREFQSELALLAQSPVGVIEVGSQTMLFKNPLADTKGRKIICYEQKTDPDSRLKSLDKTVKEVLKEADREFSSIVDPYTVEQEVDLAKHAVSYAKVMSSGLSNLLREDSISR